MPLRVAVACPLESARSVPLPFTATHPLFVTTSQLFVPQCKFTPPRSNKAAVEPPPTMNVKSCPYESVEALERGNDK